MAKKTVTLMLMVAEIDAINEEYAQDVLDAFRECCSNNEVRGVTLYRATGRDLAAFGLAVEPKMGRCFVDSVVEQVDSC